ncbi:MAG: hypothetical protein IT381_07380 [Deltaproteobacteria bacterium]|nr:hypothetical protein [Deltaproteobacteria bacterium]
MASHDQDDAFDEKTQVTGGLRTLDDFVLFTQLVKQGKQDEALFKFQLTDDRMKTELRAWDERLRDPKLAAEFDRKMRS